MSNKEKPWAIVDLESGSKPGDILTVVERFETYGEAVWWLANADEEKVNRGGYAIDGPPED